MKRLAIFAACIALLVALVLTSCKTPPPQPITAPPGKGQLLTAPAPTIWQRTGRWFGNLFSGASYTKTFDNGVQVKLEHKPGGAAVSVLVPFGARAPEIEVIDLPHPDFMPIPEEFHPTTQN